MTLPRRWLLVACGALVVGTATTLVAQTVTGTLATGDHPLTLALLLGLGGWVLLEIRRLGTNASKIHQLMVGYDGQSGLVSDVRELRERLDTENGHRKALGQSVSRLDENMRDLVRRQERVEGWAGEVGPAMGRPFPWPPTVNDLWARERDAG